ncbi:hypothetical protein PsorP6_017402 [Peronosclerospora sorghi]|uniref:Uncharacterized protein n=1 Tax=Peronosclerospora sorghi TaxID=230839 RepID=A0ACC0WL84_9STRA|nr:hypothetical protein PsorP6_017402 [Peronosclerospora sorghi]
MVRVSDVETFTNALWGSLRSLDLSSCRGISSFPDSTILPYLLVLIRDRTTISDDSLRAIAYVAPSLKYLPLQDYRMISDDGLTAIASLGDPEGCSNLELVDLIVRVARGYTGHRCKHSIQTLGTRCPKLRLITQKYYARASRMGSWDPVCKSELLFAEKKKRELVNQKTIDSDPTKNVKTTKMKLTMLCK